MVHMKWQILEVLLPFISFLHAFDRKSDHNMLIDLSFKNMRLVTMFLGCENVANIVVKYDQRLLLHLLAKTTKLLMHVDVKKNLKICNFKATLKGFVNHINKCKQSNIHRDLLSRKLVGFYWYLVDAKNCKCALYWWHKKQNKFPIVAILVQHILGIPINQIKIECIFSIARILTTLWRCHIQTKNMDKLIFVHKN